MSEGSLSTLAALVSSLLCWHFTKEFSFWPARPTLSGSDLAGLALNILDMSSEFRCWATSHSLAVMSIRRQMSMSTFRAFSWILVSKSDICCRERQSPFTWCKYTKWKSNGGSQTICKGCWWWSDTARKIYVFLPILMLAETFYLAVITSKCFTYLSHISDYHCWHQIQLV